MISKKNPGRLAVMLTALPAMAIATQAFALNILLTNDDGYGTYGNTAVKQALQAAGHTVYVSTPAEEQSGKSGSFTSDTRSTIAYDTMVAGSEWAVHGTPVDATNAGLHAFAPSVLPEGESIDLVVSGANDGENVSRLTNASGTVGAAMYAVREGVPAIAVSVGRDFAGSQALAAAYRAGDWAAVAQIRAQVEANDHAGADTAAALVVDIIDALDPDGIPAGLALNVNVPNGAVAMQGVRVTRSNNDQAYSLPLATDGAGGLVFATTYDPYLIAAYAGQPVPDDVFSPDLNVEGQAFPYGYATISILNGNFDASELTSLDAWQLACRLKPVATVKIFFCGRR